MCKNCMCEKKIVYYRFEKVGKSEWAIRMGVWTIAVYCVWDSTWDKRAVRILYFQKKQQQQHIWMLYCTHDRTNNIENDEFYQCLLFLCFIPLLAAFDSLNIFVFLYHFTQLATVFHWLWTRIFVSVLAISTCTWAKKKKQKKQRTDEHRKYHV